MARTRLRDMDRDYFLNLLGLETKGSAQDWFLPAVSVFGLGCLVGVTIGLVLAPGPGRELRDRLRSRFQSRVGEEIGMARSSSESPSSRTV